MAAVDLAIDDVLRLRKAHPCGSHEWRVVRLGADIGLLCGGCGHRILMDRLDVERRYLAHVSRGADAPGAERAP
ncbi:MAG TPA: DUF951 domain-containing protein [Candidatus Limnocylindria bacterium]|nr:DUF951 domain-containing protein [Candidatus Limnocylindria bacterium]